MAASFERLCEVCCLTVFLTSLIFIDIGMGFRALVSLCPMFFFVYAVILAWRLFCVCMWTEGVEGMSLTSEA